MAVGLIKRRIRTKVGMKANQMKMGSNRILMKMEKDVRIRRKGKKRGRKIKKIRRIRKIS